MIRFVPFTREQKRCIAAHHEAGHTAVAIVEGVSVPCVVVNESDQWAIGPGVTGRTIIEWPGHTLAGRARVQMAGPIAENLAAAHRIVPLSAGFDANYKQHAAVITECGGDAVQAAREARMILAYEWRFVVALADELNRAGVIDQQGITAIAVKTMRGDALRTLNQR